jgi:iron complex transport system substrate-binding protein
MKKYLLLFISFLVCIFSSCNGGKTASDAMGGDTLHFKYAKNIEVVKYDGYSVVKLKDPWKTSRILHTYVLAEDKVLDSKAVKELKADGAAVINVPVKRSVVFSTVHCALLYDLKCEKAITGVCDLKYINIPDVHKRIGRNITDCGNGMSADVEKIIDSKPQALVISPFENSGGYGKLDDINIPIVEAADYMEPTALGRAEWMIFYGMLYGREKEAETLFKSVDDNYNELKAEAIKSRIRRSVITELKTGSVWYVPGGKSTIAQMIADANGRYIYAADKSAGSLSLPFERVLDDAGNADVWMYKYDVSPSSLSALKADYSGYAEMKAFRNKDVYGADCTLTRYYEEASFHPDRLLRDMIIILHPDLRLGKLRYYHKLKN